MRIDTENWRVRTVVDTFTHAHLYQYERRPFFFAKNGDKVCIKREAFMDRYDSMASSERDKVNNKEVDTYKRCENTRKLENYSNYYHLRDCISLCDELGSEYESQLIAFTKLLTSFPPKFMEE